jgi:class 3 adenylate cyclase
LKDGDSLRVGATQFTFRQPGMAGPASTGEGVHEQTFMEVRSEDCWLLLGDLEGSTQIAQQLDPAQLSALTAAWLQQCRKLIESSGGTVNKFLGDGFLAYWTERAQTAGEVAEAARELKRIQQEAEPRFRVVVHVGKVFVGGGASLGEESLLGNEVNFVFRMEKLAGALGIACLLSEAASRPLQPLLPTEEAGRHALPGFDGEFPFFSF